jgi:cell division protein FtsL
MAARSEAAVPAPHPARPAERTGNRPPARRARPRHGVTGGVVSIAVVAVLLAGVVALNVAVLRLNVRLDRLGEQRSRLRAQNAELASQISAAASSPRIQQLAHDKLGLVPADPSLTTYVNLIHR